MHPPPPRMSCSPLMAAGAELDAASVFKTCICLWPVNANRGRNRRTVRLFATGHNVSNRRPAHMFREPRVVAATGVVTATAGALNLLRRGA
jgi:hypothetical protein